MSFQKSLIGDKCRYLLPIKEQIHQFLLKFNSFSHLKLLFYVFALFFLLFYKIVGWQLSFFLGIMEVFCRITCFSSPHFTKK